MCGCVFSKVESETQVSRLTQSAQDQYEVNVRAANIVSYKILGGVIQKIAWLFRSKFLS